MKTHKYTLSRNLSAHRPEPHGESWLLLGEGQSCQSLRSLLSLPPKSLRLTTGPAPDPVADAQPEPHPRPGIGRKMAGSAEPRGHLGAGTACPRRRRGARGRPPAILALPPPCGGIEWVAARPPASPAPCQALRAAAPLAGPRCRRPASPGCKRRRNCGSSMTAWPFTLTVCGRWSWRTTGCCWRSRRRKRSPPGRYGRSGERAAPARRERLRAGVGARPGARPARSRPFPARRAVAAPCGRRAMRVRWAGSGGCADPAPTRAAPRPSRGLSGRGVALRAYWRHIQGGSGRDSAPAGARAGGWSGEGRRRRCGRCWRLLGRLGCSMEPLRSLGRGRGWAGAADGPSPPMPRAHSTRVLGVGCPLQPLSGWVMQWDGRLERF